jgi:uncharacterized membrane protein (DUF106 family)
VLHALQLCAMGEKNELGKDPFKKVVVIYTVIVLIFLMMMVGVAIYYTKAAAQLRDESSQSK